MMYYPEPSPFEQYRLKHLKGIAMSAEIYQMIAEAFEAGQAAEREACAVIAFNAKTYIEAAEAIRARGQE